VGDQWRRQHLVSGGHDDQGAKGASIEVPKAPNGVGYGEGYPLHSRLGCLGEHCELLQWGLGRSPGRYRICAYFRPQNASGTKKNTKNFKFHFEKVVVTVTTTFKSGGDKSPSVTYKVAPMYFVYSFALQLCCCTSLSKYF